MFRWIIISLFLGNLLACAAIQGAQGDAAMAKKTAAAQTANQDAENTDSNVPPLGPSTTPAQRAQTNAAKLIAPLTH